MLNDEAEVIRISRLLTPENRANLLSLVNLAHFAENSTRKSLGIDAVNNGVSISKPLVYSCGNSLHRSKK
jgi:predicted HAD superfamily hydrolase